MTTLVPNASVQKLERLFPLLHKTELTYIDLRANQPVTGYTERTGLEVPLTPEISFTAEEVDSILKWIKFEAVLVGLKGSSIVLTAVNLKGRLFRADYWGAPDHHSLRFQSLDYRTLMPESLKELDFHPTSSQETEEALNALSQGLYGQKVNELDEEDRNDLRALINEVLSP